MSYQADPEREAPPADGPMPTKLEKYRHMTGIVTPWHLIESDPPRPGPNIGIYARIIDEERRAGRNYTIVSSIINLTFLGQIVVAAAITALGASNSAHVGVTILGSINTIIAGVQTYLKGQGLPNRIQQYEFGLRKLREHMEDRERDFTHPECTLDVDHVVEDIAAMYQAVRQTAEDNTPDTYLPMGGAGKKLLGSKDPAAAAASATTPAAAVAAAAKAPDPAKDIDAIAAAENAEAEKAKKDKGKEKDDKPSEGAGAEASGHGDAHAGDGDESTPLLATEKKQDAK